MVLCCNPLQDDSKTLRGLHAPELLSADTHGRVLSPGKVEALGVVGGKAEGFKSISACARSTVTMRTAGSSQARMRVNAACPAWYHEAKLVVASSKRQSLSLDIRKTLITSATLTKPITWGFSSHVGCLTFVVGPWSRACLQIMRCRMREMRLRSPLLLESPLTFGTLAFFKTLRTVASRGDCNHLGAARRFLYSTCTHGCMFRNRKPCNLTAVLVFCDPVALAIHGGAPSQSRIPQCGAL
jgi:hypothetical protein